jgi:hypothetical protein
MLKYRIDLFGNSIGKDPLSQAHDHDVTLMQLLEPPDVLAKLRPLSLIRPAIVHVLAGERSHGLSNSYGFMLRRVFGLVDGTINFIGPQQSDQQRDDQKRKHQFVADGHGWSPIP